MTWPIRAHNILILHRINMELIYALTLAVYLVATASASSCPTNLTTFCIGKPDNALFPNPCDNTCNQYINCYGGRGFLQYCPSATPLFNPKGYCDAAGSFVCNPSFPPPSPISPPSPPASPSPPPSPPSPPCIGLGGLGHNHLLWRWRDFVALWSSKL